jgi:hypothetical protein
MCVHFVSRTPPSFLRVVIKTKFKMPMTNASKRTVDTGRIIYILV